MKGRLRRVLSAAGLFAAAAAGECYVRSGRINRR